MNNRNETIIDQMADAVEENDTRQFHILAQRDDVALLDQNAYISYSWLFLSARYGFLDGVRFLIGKGLDPDIDRNFRDGVTALWSACSSGHCEVAKYLLDHGAVMDVTASVRNPLFAAISGSIQVNAAHKPPTGEASQIVRLLLERGIDSTVRYNSKTMKNMDAVAFALMWGARDLAHIVALWNAKGDEALAQAVLEKADQIAEANTVPVPKGELVKPS